MRYREDLQQKIEQEQGPINLLNQSSTSSIKKGGNDELGYTYYSKKLEKDLDTNDLLLDERKLRKLYNIVHKEKVPITSLSKLAQ